MEIVVNNITVTEAVYDKLSKLLVEEDNDAIQALRIFVQGGGCSGFQYGFQFAEEISEDDAILEDENGIKIAIDPMSMVYLEGATIDYTKSIMGEQFSITNPNATTTCGCGSSFGA
jgi:iron-sulfur cluster insertion protein